jgi:uncharacterized membrane-anchored protein
MAGMHCGAQLYWVAIWFSNSLGTSSGDFIADSLGIGFRDSALSLCCTTVSQISWRR